MKIIEIEEAVSFDFHCHIDLYPEPQAIIKDCEKNKVFTLAVTTTPKAWHKNLEWTYASKYVKPALGLHPELVGERFHELVLLEEYLSEAYFVGEVGLDGSPQYKSSRGQQKEVFSRVVAESINIGNKILSIHSRFASKEVVEILASFNTLDKIRCVLHWFTGTQDEVELALKLGCYFSVNHKMLKTVKGRMLLKKIPLEKILTETDGPFTSTKGRLIYPSNTLEVVAGIAALKGMHVEELHQAIKNNVKHLICFPELD